MINAFNLIDKFLNKTSGQLIFALLLTAIILLPFLSGGWVAGDDATKLIIPQLNFYKNAISSGQSPFWNPNVAVGFPNFIDISHPFSPVVLLSLLLSPVTAHYWWLFVLLSATFFLTILFLKELDLGVYPALIGAMAYLISSIWFTQSVFVVTAIFSQVLIFWFLLRISRGASRRFGVLVGAICVLALANNWLSIGYWINLYLFFASLAFAVFLFLKNRDSGKRVFIFFFAIWSLGTVVGLLQIIPTYILSQFSGRGGGLDAGSAAGYVIGLKELFNFLHFTPRRGLDAYLYMGIAPLIFWIFSFRVKGDFIRFFRWLFFLVFFIAVSHSQIFWLIQKLPLFNLFQGASRFLFIANLAVAVLVGYGAKYFFNNANRSPVIPVLMSTLLAFGSAILWSSKLVLPVASSLVLIALFILISKYVRKELLPLLLTSIVVIDFIFAFSYFQGPGLTSIASYIDPPATAGFFKSHPGRILPLFVDDWDNQYFYQLFQTSAPHSEDAPYLFALERETYQPNYQNLDGIENLEANEPLLNTSMARLMALLGTRQLANTGGEEKLDKTYEVITELTGETKIEEGQELLGVVYTDISVMEKFRVLKERIPLINFLGIKYLLAAYNLEEEKIPGFIPVSYIELYIMGKDKPSMPMIIYDNPYAKPIAYFSKVSGYKTDPEVIHRAFKDGGFKDIFVECSDCPTKKFTTQGKIGLAKKENGRVELLTESPAEQFLVFTQNYLPGWRAYIDGKEVEIYKVNTVFPGVFVPTGKHKVEFVYDYWSLFNPKWLFLSSNSIAK